MSIRLMAQLWDNEDHDLSGSKLLVVLCLADHSNDDGVCWPSINRIAKRTRIDRRSVMRNLQALEEMGYITVVRTPGRPNRYTVNATRGNSVTGGKNVTGGNSVTPTRGNNVTPTRGKNVTGGVVTVSPEPSYNHHSEPSIKSSSADELIDPEVTEAIGKWQAVFAGTPFEAVPPVSRFHSWLAFGGIDVLLHMIEVAREKAERNPAGWLYTTYDNWRKDGEVAPYIAQQVESKRAASAPAVPIKIGIIWPDGTTGEVETTKRV